MHRPGIPLLLREGRLAEARKAVERMPTAPHYHRDLLQACLQGPPSELDAIATKALTTLEADPEVAYYQGSMLAFCDKKDAAVHLLKKAIESNYCAYSQLQSDPLLAKLRSTAEFGELLTAAHACQQAVLSNGGP